LWVTILFLTNPGEEGRRGYCPACRRLLNRCVAFLALLGLSVFLLHLFGQIPVRR